MTAPPESRQPDLGPSGTWGRREALEAYGIPRWGLGYIDITSGGRLQVCPDCTAHSAVDLCAVVEQLQDLGVSLPVLLRFPGILRHRLRSIAGAFADACAREGYLGSYHLAYPVKVNQDRHVLQHVVATGVPHEFGLEAGSKPEFLLVTALGKQGLVVCNGYKDRDTLELIILAQKAGIHVVPVAETLQELHELVNLARRHETRPRLGLRVKLSTRGAGRWEQTGGIHSKFGMSVPELTQGLTFLQAEGMQDCLELLHGHLGSQIPVMRTIKESIAELARIYVELRRLGAGLRLLNIGGGLAVDYDGSQTRVDCSMNYTLEEYASETVWRVKTICDEADVPHPTLVTESGRALVAYHSVLLTDVIRVIRWDSFPLPTPLPIPREHRDFPRPLVDLLERHADVNQRNCLEYFHDVLQALEQVMHLFTMGYLDLLQRDLAERLFWATCLKIKDLTATMKAPPEDLSRLTRILADVYLCNLSFFRSLPDSWAVDQLFPIVPIQRLDEPPVRRGRLADLTCDSDGMLRHYVLGDGTADELLLHLPDGQPYRLAIFLTGAYQEALGCSHNLLGRIPVVSVERHGGGSLQLEPVSAAEPVDHLLASVGHRSVELWEQVQQRVEVAVGEGRLAQEEAGLLLGLFQAGLEGSSYLST